VGSLKVRRYLVMYGLGIAEGVNKLGVVSVLNDNCSVRSMYHANKWSFECDMVQEIQTPMNEPK
jgi:hypothetical protein